MILQACSGMMSITGEENGPPARSPFSPVEYEHGVHGLLKTLAQPILFNRQRNQLASPPPVLGEHTAQILHEVGYSERDVQRLVEGNVVSVSAASR
ncbi:MAG TPA: hypothetical protein VNG69_03290 [Casimicrobiaceae bacterium]|nr:hypothetical protein [Casimicrobiaceae bacterium]